MDDAHAITLALLPTCVVPKIYLIHIEAKDPQNPWTAMRLGRFPRFDSSRALGLHTYGPCHPAISDHPMNPISPIPRRPETAPLNPNLKCGV